MSKYRISKAGREFPAEQLDTLRELATRGLLLAGDEVSVDGGPFRPASELAELADVLQDHGELEELEEAALAEVTAPDALLAQFLDEVHTGSMKSVPGSAVPGASTTGSMPPVRSPSTSAASLPPVGSPSTSAASLPPVRPEPPRVVRAQPDSVPAAPLPVAADLPELDVGIESLPKGLADLPPDETPPPPPPVIEPAGPDTLTAPPEPAEPKLTIPEPKAEADLPVSFNEWLESRGTTPEGKVLEGFGRYDDGIAVQGGYQTRSFNGIRVFLLFALGCTIVFGWWIWVRTAATTQYPKESELQAQMLGRRGTAKPTVTDTRRDGNPVDAKRLLRMDEERLRKRIGQDVPFFGSATTLEDELFTALQNAGARPAGVDVEAIATKGSNDREDGRPTKANVTLLLRGASGDGDEAAQFEALKEQLQIAWLVAGKFSAKGKVDFLEVDVVVTGTKTPWNETYEGRRLRSFWERHLTTADFFASE